MQVDRCICSDILFSDVKKVVAEQNLKSVEELRERGICARNCRLCDPYLKEMIRTGRVSFKPGSVNSIE